MVKIDKILISDIGVLLFIAGLLGIIGTLMISIFLNIPANRDVSTIIILIAILGLMLMSDSETSPSDEV